MEDLDHVPERVNDEDNRAAVATVTIPHLDIVGMTFRCERRTVDKLLKSLKLLR